MNIDRNEQPEQEPVEDENEESFYPSDLTLENVRGAVTEIIEENSEREVVQIDLASIPNGMSIQDTINIYQTQGIAATTVDSTNYTSGTDTYTTTSGYAPTRASVPEKVTTVTEVTLPSKNEWEKRWEEKSGKRYVKLTPEQLITYRRDKHCRQIIELHNKSQRKIYDLIITKADLIIGIGSNHELFFYHIDAKGSYLVYDSTTRYIGKNGNKYSQLLSNSLNFDKDMNYLIVDNELDDKATMTSREGIRVHRSQLYHSEERETVLDNCFIIIDKMKFIRSRGKEMIIKWEQGVSYVRIKEIKQIFEKTFIHADQLLLQMKLAVEAIHPVEDFDIMYSINGRSHGYNRFALLLKYKNVTISNSIEDERFIGDMIIKSIGRHNHDIIHPYNAPFIGGISGTRMSFTPDDASVDYQHSHLPSSMMNFNSFCTGSENYGSGNTNEISFTDIQHHIIRIDEFIRWESLEGGPHCRMEDKNIYGKKINIAKTGVGKTRAVSDNYIKRLIREVNRTEKGFASFSDCFTLINVNGNLKFIVDYNKFYDKFIEIIPKTAIKEINQMYRIKTVYDPIHQNFHLLPDINVLEQDQLIKKAYRKMIYLTPVYMNGKYHRPYLSTLEQADITKKVKISPDPSIMRELAQIILYNLTDKLEKYGNTSEK